MRYIQECFRGRVVTGVCHIIKRLWVYTPGPDPLPANMVETWCRCVYQDRTGLLPDQETDRYKQGIGHDQLPPKTNARATRQKTPPAACYSWPDDQVCPMCQETLRVNTEYPGQLTAMDNEALYQEFRDQHHPDDYDGQFTTAGELRLQLVVAEMEKRLRECGFLSANMKAE